MAGTAVALSNDEIKVFQTLTFQSLVTISSCFDEHFLRLQHFSWNLLPHDIIVVSSLKHYKAGSSLLLEKYDYSFTCCENYAGFLAIPLMHVNVDVVT